MAEWLTEQSRTAKERRRHDGDPEGEVRSTESRATLQRQWSKKKSKRRRAFGEVAEWLTEQSKTAKERRRHDGDPEGEVRSTE